MSKLTSVKLFRVDEGSLKSIFSSHADHALHFYITKKQNMKYYMLLSVLFLSRIETCFF